MSRDEEATHIVPVADDATRLAPDSLNHEQPTRIAPQHQVDHDEPTRLAPRQAAEAVTAASAQLQEDDFTRAFSAPDTAMPRRRNFRPGDLIRNRFRLERLLGQGGMGVVYIARDLRKEEVGDPDSLVAIKLLSENFKVHPEALRMLQQETRKAQKLAHPNVVTVFDFDRDGDTVYMTMEYLTGMPLTEYIHEHSDAPPSLQEVLPIVRDIVQGLEYAHERGIVHSDLKPANVFLTDEGVTKILDFGIARAIMDKGQLRKEAQAAQQGTFQAQGDTQRLFALTPKYASPEMFEDAEPDPRDDVYALAVITYELLTGQHPFDGRPANEAKLLGLKPKPVPGLSDRQWKGLARGLSLTRETRTPTAAEFLEAFLPKRKNPWVWATLSAGLIAVAVAVYFMLRPPQEAPLTPQERAVVDQEIAVAREHMEVGNLATALENYKMILALPPYDKNPPGGGFVQHPYDRKALKDLEKLLDELADQAKAALDAGYPADARAFVEAGLAVEPEHRRLNDLKMRLQALQSSHSQTQ